MATKKKSENTKNSSAEQNLTLLRSMLLIPGAVVASRAHQIETITRAERGAARLREDLVPQLRGALIELAEGGRHVKHRARSRSTEEEMAELEDRLKQFAGRDFMKKS